VAEEVAGQPAPQEPMDVETHAATIARGLLESEEGTPAKVEKPRDEKGKFTKEAQEAPVEAPEQPAEEAPPAEEETPQEETPAEIRKHKLTVKAEDGSDLDLEVDDEELKKGYMLEKSYRHKTAQIAREREAIQAKIKEATDSKVKEYEEKLQIAEKAIWDTLMPEIQTINWNQLAKDNPAEWAQKYQHVQNVNAKLAQIQAERDKLAKDRAEEIRSSLKKQAEEAVETLKSEIPNWSNDLYGKILTTGLEHGFKQEEVNAITDPRAIKVLWKAMQYDALQRAKPSVEKRVAPQAPKVVKPGAGEKPDANANKWNEGMARLQKTGKAQDAVEVAKLLLARENRR
jgi:hypothetical protein